MRIVVDHKLRIARSELSSDVEKLIADALSIPNMERQKMMEQGIPGWQRLPETVALYEWDSGSQHMLLPRGFLKSLAYGLMDLEIEFELDDQTLWEPDLPPLHRQRGIELYSWQSVAIDAIMQRNPGIWKAPAGSGKTIGVLGLLEHINCPSLVLVNTKDILYQWRDRALSFFGEDFPVGLIGDGNFKVSDYLTIATVQTLHSRFAVLERDGFFDDQFSLVCLDECHHATAETYSRLMSRFTASLRLGVSATPDKTGDFELAKAVLGPIIHETPKTAVTNLVRPTIFRIPTQFRFKYHGREGRRPSNYDGLIHELVRDNNRNALIASTIKLNEWRHNLVCSRRLAHLQEIDVHLRMRGYAHEIYFLTGAETSETRQLVIAAARAKPCVILSTLADEALDIPRLDGIYLTFPLRNTGLVEQMVGRVARKSPGKQDAAVFDFCDPIGPCESQWQARRNHIYMPNNYTITTVLPEEIFSLVEQQK